MEYYGYLFGLLATFVVFSTGCEQVDDLIGGADAPQITYPATTLEAEFYKPGSSSAPSIMWNGDQGTISLGTILDGLSINSTTGQIQWSKMLPPGKHAIDVIVTNSEGQVVVPVTIENPMRGTFSGLYADYYDFTLNFKEGGELSVQIDQLQATGTWELDGDELTAYYAYDNNPANDYSLVADFKQTPAAATITGDYYSGVYEIGDTPISNFEVTLE